VGDGIPPATGAKPTLLLSFDFEDWHQLVLQRPGAAGPETTNPAFVRQVRAVLDFLDSAEATATFFLLGMTAVAHPRLVQEVVERGHEPACHGYGHVRAFRQSPTEFRADVEASIALITRLTGRRPVGYRAPAFSLNRDTTWAYGILADLGFDWDSSQYDSPRIPRRFRPIPRAPYLLCEPGGRRIWELPLAVCRLWGRSVPLGGGSYWRVLPQRAVANALRDRDVRDRPAALYFHPYEFDPDALRVPLPPASSGGRRLRARMLAYRYDPGRRRLQATLARVAREFRLTSYERELESIKERHGTHTRALSQDGALV
jgi:polysaccharide deacetylase family protein (PEP-CTERM system associated)